MDFAKDLTITEQSQLIKAPLLVILLIGKADGKLDREERLWALKLINAKTFTNPKELQHYWQAVLQDFDSLEKIELQLPEDPQARGQLLAEKLSVLNSILPKLAPKFAWFLYKGLCQLAEETAKASGGFLRIGAVSAAEHRWVKLPMLNTIQRPTDLAETPQEED